MLTWILVALRAATEPVKEEAMQAILEVWVIGVCSKNVCGNGVGTAIGDDFTQNLTRFVSNRGGALVGKESRKAGSTRTHIHTTMHKRKSSTIPRDLEFLTHISKKVPASSDESHWSSTRANISVQ